MTVTGEPLVFAREYRARLDSGVHLFAMPESGAQATRICDGAKADGLWTIDERDCKLWDREGRLGIEYGNRTCAACLEVWRLDLRLGIRRRWRLTVGEFEGTGVMLARALVGPPE